MKRTCSNVFDWLKPAKLVPMIDEHPSKMLKDLEDEIEDMEVDDKDREERL